MARTRQKWDSETERKARSLDALAEYEEFCETFPAKLRRMVLENWSNERIRQEFASVIQAQVILKALQGNFNACKDTLDRYEGTPIKRVESKSVYKQMDKKELAALAYQKLIDAGLIPKGK